MMRIGNRYIPALLTLVFSISSCKSSPAALPSQPEAAVSAEYKTEEPAADEPLDLAGLSADDESDEYILEVFFSSVLVPVEYYPAPENLSALTSSVLPALPEPAVKESVPLAAQIPAAPPVQPDPPAPVNKAVSSPAPSVRPVAISAASADEPAPPAQTIPDEPEIMPEVPEPELQAYPYSRIVRATVGQLVEVPFRGTGWVYLGEANARRGISYDSRRLDPEGQSFVFRVEAAGIYALKFYRQDFIANFILNDYVQVTAGNAPESAGSGWFNPPVDSGRVVAEPRWPAAYSFAPAGSQANPQVSANTNTSEASNKGDAAPAEPSTSQAAPSLQSSPAVQQTQATAPAVSSAAARQPAAKPPASSGDDSVAPVRPPSVTGALLPKIQDTVQLSAEAAPGAFVNKAREEFDAGRIDQAVSVLNQLCTFYPSGTDEAFWLYGQCYEANSSSRNILLALEYYRRLIREYPQSSRASEARRRVSYLERYYINIQ